MNCARAGAAPHSFCLIMMTLYRDNDIMIILCHGIVHDVVQCHGLAAPWPLNQDQASLTSMSTLITWLFPYPPGFHEGTNMGCMLPM